MSGDCDLCGSYDHVESFHNCRSCIFWKKTTRRSGLCLNSVLKLWDTKRDTMRAGYTVTQWYHRCENYNQKT